MIQQIRGARFRGVNVLVAEDSTINRRLSRLLLEMSGCAVVTATSGREAVDAFRRQHFDLVLMNCQMPQIDGFEATEQIRHIEHQRRTGHRVPIIAMTAFALPSDRNHCIRRGMDDFLIKPLRRELLEDVLGRWLHVRSLTA